MGNRLVAPPPTPAAAIVASSTPAAPEVPAPEVATADQSVVTVATSSMSATTTPIAVPAEAVGALFRVPSLSASAIPSPRVILNTSSGILKTFMCRICLCYEELRHAFTVPNCTHQFCVTCLSGYLTSQIVDGRILLQCPDMGEENRRCDSILTTADVAAVVADPAVLAKLERFRAARENPESCVCPDCNAILKGDPAAPRVTCITCGRVFCFLHSDAHPPEESCADFELRSKGHDACTQDLLNKTSKPCPKCSARTYKYTGCNHMKCSQCSQDWCWLCGEGIVIAGPYPRHYDRRNPTSSCAGRQFTQDGNEEEQHNPCGRFFRVLFYYSPFAIPFYLLAVVLYALITALTLPCLLASATYRAVWLRRCIIVRMVTICWALVCFVAILIGLTIGFVLTWLGGIVIGALCLPVCALSRERDLGRDVWCCCCWPVVLVNGVVSEEPEAAV